MTGAEPLLLGSRGNRFAPSGFFVLRTPLLPFETFMSLRGARAHVRARLRALIERPEIREAIFLASPGLEERLAVWLEDPGGERGAGIEAALLRYVTRMSTRPTPFGLCAGVTPGQIGPHTSLSVPPIARARRHTRLDAHYLAELAQALERDPEIRGRLRYAPNTSLYEIAGRLRYASGRVEGGRRSYHLVAVEPSDYLLETLSRARGGATIEELARPLIGDDVPMADARAFVNELVDAQLLVSDLAPPVTGEEMTAAFVSRLRERVTSSPALDVLSEINALTRAMDADGIGVSVARYRKAAEALEALPADVDLGRLFQVDLHMPAANAVLGSKVLVEIGRGVELLRRFEASAPDALDRFRGRFRERYGDRTVPLVEALDEETGIGFDAASSPTSDGGPLLDGLVFPGTSDTTTAWRPLQTFLLDRIAGADPGRSLETVLDPKDVESLVPGPGKPLPDAIQVKASIAARDENALRSGAFRVVVDSVAGPSGARLLGRFCHASPEIRAGVEAHLRQEEALDPDAIFAEIVHLPEGRLANILFRPVLRAHEIPYLGRSSAPPERQIPVTDLVVSLAGDRVVLRSRSLGKRIHPRLSSAHNFSHGSLGLYRFLCSLQHEGSAVRLLWEWGAVGTAPFLPRIVVGKTVLARASWTLTKGELEALGRARGAARTRAVAALRERREIPRLVYLADADNRLLVDFENEVSIDAFVPLVARRPRAVLIEMYPPPDELVARGPDGHFVHEIVVPFVGVREPHAARGAESTSEVRSAERPESETASTEIIRRFAPGSEWLTMKLYAGSATADVVLRDLVGPLVRAAREAGEIDRWFFLRYADPDPHLRVRLHGEPAVLAAKLLPRLHEAARPFLENDQVFRIQLDTYDREIERYGGPRGIETAEAIFEADSDAALALGGALSGDEGADLRWRGALFGVHALFGDLGLDEEAARAVARVLEAGYQAEFRADSTLRKGLGARFAAERTALERLLWGETAEAWEKTVRAIFAARSARVRPLGIRLLEIERAGSLREPTAVLARSFVHMHVNRVLRAAHRAQEVVLYTLLHRLYLSRTKRLSKEGSKS